LLEVFSAPVPSRNFGKPMESAVRISGLVWYEKKSFQATTGIVLARLNSMILFYDHTYIQHKIAPILPNFYLQIGPDKRNFRIFLNS
jgi:hypothetical protein